MVAEEAEALLQQPDEKSREVPAMPDDHGFQAQHELKKFLAHLKESGMNFKHSREYASPSARAQRAARRESSKRTSQC